MRLNLGCGGDPRPGMLNVDIEGEGCQLECDATDLPWKDGTVAHIQALHLVEHLGWVGCCLAFCEWFRVLSPGASLVIETPDLLESARQLGQAPFARRAVLANWIYGLESPGMQHKFGFEHAVLSDLLASCGFVRIRRQQPRSHIDLPGLRVVAERGNEPAQQVHAHFKRLLRARGLAPAQQALAVELHLSIAHDLVRTLARPRLSPGSLHALFARLTVHDPRIARAALDAARPLLARSLRTRWDRVLAHPRTETLPKVLAGALLERPILAGQMASSYRAVCNRFRSQLRAWGADRHAPFAAKAVLRADVELCPFSPAGLCAEAERRRAVGLRCFVDGAFEEAEHHLELSARFNSNASATFWNLARLALRTGRTEQALRWLDDAVRSTSPSTLAVRAALLRERKRVAAGRHVEPLPVSPVAMLAEIRP